MSRRSGVLLALVSASAFATLGLFAKLIYAAGFSVAQTLAWRFSIAALALWIFMVSRGAWRRPAREYRDALLLGAFGFSPQAGLYFLTVRYLDPGIASLLLYLYPAFVVLFSAIFLVKKPRKMQLLALVLSLTGCTITLWTRGSYPWFGYALGIAVALSYAAYLTVGEKILSRLDPVFATTCVMSASAVVYWLITIGSGGVQFPSTLMATLGILGVGLFATVLPVVTLFGAMRRIGAADTSLVSTIEPLVTILLSAALLGERLGALQLAGGALILSGVLALNSRSEIRADSVPELPPG
ncbi:MAG: hypothetical protein E4H20_06900 [Spirochaetales bacterium]|nr:MAG: hypothetical protein E4H20_06900 [Spirochaetales bacterium]